jgi:Short repeat of unknown function (DUF308)
VTIAVVVLKFIHASAIAVGVLTGVMFLVLAAEAFLLAVLGQECRQVVMVIFGVLLTASGIIALTRPAKTFSGFADILGLVFLMIGILWTVQAFTERPLNDVWWLGLISGSLSGSLMV